MAVVQSLKFLLEGIWWRWNVSALNRIYKQIRPDLCYRVSSFLECSRQTFMWFGCNWKHFVRNYEYFVRTIYFKSTAWNTCSSYYLSWSDHTNEVGSISESLKFWQSVWRREHFKKVRHFLHRRLVVKQIYEHIFKWPH